MFLDPKNDYSYKLYCLHAVPETLNPKSALYPPTQNLNYRTRTHHGTRFSRSHARALGLVATRLRASVELRGQRRVAGLQDDWRQASTKAHDVVRASADGVQAVLVVRVNGPVESAVEEPLAFHCFLIIRCSAASHQWCAFALLV